MSELSTGNPGPSNAHTAPGFVTDGRGRVIWATDGPHHLARNGASVAAAAPPVSPAAEDAACEAGDGHLEALPFADIMIAPPPPV